MRRLHSTLALVVVVLAAGLAGSTPTSIDGTVSAAFRRGDTNGDGSFDISDPVATLMWLFQGADGPTCADAADTNDDGDLDISDAMWGLQYLFLGAAPPPPPFAVCGVDPTPDPLGCEVFGACDDVDFFELVARTIADRAPTDAPVDVNVLALDATGPTDALDELLDP